MNALTNHTAKYATFLCLAILAGLLTGNAHATEIVAPGIIDSDSNNISGQVTLPLDEYQQLLQQATTQPLPAPSGYAVGQSVINVVFHQRDGRVTATVQAQVEVETFENEWTLVSLLGPGAAQ